MGDTGPGGPRRDPRRGLFASLEFLQNSGGTRRQKGSQLHLLCVRDGAEGGSRGLHTGAGLCVVLPGDSVSEPVFVSSCLTLRRRVDLLTGRCPCLYPCRCRRIVQSGLRPGVERAGPEGFGRVWSNGRPAEAAIYRRNTFALCTRGTGPYNTCD